MYDIVCGIIYLSIYLCRYDDIGVSGEKDLSQGGRAVVSAF